MLICIYDPQQSSKLQSRLVCTVINYDEIVHVQNSSDHTEICMYIKLLLEVYITSITSKSKTKNK